MYCIAKPEIPRLGVDEETVADAKSSLLPTGDSTSAEAVAWFQPKGWGEMRGLDPGGPGAFQRSACGCLSWHKGLEIGAWRRMLPPLARVHLFFEVEVRFTSACSLSSRRVI